MISEAPITKITVLPDAGPEVMAESAEVDVSYFSYNVHPKIDDPTGTDTFIPQGGIDGEGKDYLNYSHDANVLSNLHMAPRSASQRAVDQVNRQYHGVKDPDA